MYSYQKSIPTLRERYTLKKIIVKKGFTVKRVGQSEMVIENLVPIVKKKRNLTRFSRRFFGKQYKYKHSKTLKNFRIKL